MLIRNRPSSVLSPGQQAESPAILILGDLTLFASFCMARVMIWKAIRRERSERSRRLKRMKLVPRLHSAHQKDGELKCKI
jgi:hypothetical protein